VNPMVFPASAAPSPMSIDALKSLLRNTADGNVFFEDMGEVHGTLIVDRSVSLSIRGTTLIGRGAPAIAVSSGASLDLRHGQVTTTERDPRAVANSHDSDWRAGTAIRVDTGGQVSLTDVDLMGDVSGDCSLAGEWHLPSAWMIQSLPARSRTILAIRGCVPYRVEVTSDIHNVASTHPTLGPGPVEFAIDVDARDFEAGALLDGWIRFSGGGTVRRLRLRARLVAAADRPALPPPLWEARAFASPPAVPSVPPNPVAVQPAGGRVPMQKPAGLSGVFGRNSAALHRGGEPQPTDASVPQVGKEIPSRFPSQQPLASAQPAGRGQAPLSPVFGKSPVRPSGADNGDTGTSTPAGPSDSPPAITGVPEEQAPPTAPNPAPVAPVMNRGGVSSVFRRPGGPSPSSPS
jgi:hypothetical protein